MKYLFRGKLCGYICPQCPEAISEAISNVVIRIYRAEIGQDLAALATAEPKATFAILDEEAVRQKEATLLAEAKTDVEGNFTIELGNGDDYQGGAIQFDVYAETVPGKPSERFSGPPLQFTITTLQPKWRERGKQLVAVWDYCIPSRFWCIIRRHFGAWVICGQVTSCETGTPLAAVKVYAFDRDWLEDDPLGDGVTDSTGHFRIDYAAEDFAVTPFSPLINVELVSGPDIYFRIESAGGTTLLEESPSRGRDPDRENIGPCFCADLCVEVEDQPPVNNPWFTHVGDFHILTDISGTTGRTNSAIFGHGGPDYGFFRRLKLKGFCPKTHPVSSQPMRYRFLYDHADVPSGLVPITGPMVSPVLVGSRLIQWDLDGTGPAWTFQSIYVQASGATPDPTPIPAVPPGTPWGPVPAHIINPDSDGWVTIDQNALDNGFYGPLLRFNTNAAVPGGSAPGDGAGNALSDPKNGAMLQIVFEAGPLGSPATHSNVLPKIHVNNWEEVRELNLQQFVTSGSGCSPLTSDLDILYTADHELLAEWQISITTAAPVSIPSLPGGTGPRGSNGVHHLNISSWPSCSYTVILTTRRSLTNGEQDDDADEARVTFCK